jgi:O-antigen/teichoic acid export membrane protein
VQLRSRLGKIRRRALSREGIARDIGKLFAGSGGAQIANVLGSLLLARLFLPEQFVGLTLLVPTALILSRVSQLKYETAIATARNRSEMGALAAVANFCLWSVAALSVIVSLILLPQLTEKLGLAGAIVFIICLPVTVLFNGWLNTANIWAIRWRQFNTVAANEFIRVTGTMGVQILAGLAKLGGTGLMAGQACGTAIAYFAMTLRGTLGELRVRAKRTSWRRMRLVAWSYRDFALFQTPKAAINASSRNLPPILLAAMYDAAITGLFFFAFRLTLMPANLLGTSVGRVLMQRFANLRLEKRSAAPLLLRSTVLILVPSLLLVGVLWWLGPPLFAFFLGEEWRAAGALAAWTALWSASIIVAAPGEKYLIVNRRNGLLFALELAFLPPRFLPFFYFAAQQDGEAAIIWCCAASALYSLVTAATAIVISRGNKAVLARGKPQL